jgi:glycine/D-amino acid oxidase-like deaminating enzyme/nitrite reductase/ring-hydroxylating ferredoxin subunit
MRPTNNESGAVRTDDERPRRIDGHHHPHEIRSPWTSGAGLPPFDPLKGDLQVDVAIVGGGITGLSAATLLADAGKTVAIIDAHRIAHGESARTTAHLTAYPDRGISELRSRFGDEKARAVWDSGRAALQQIEQWVAARNIACDLARVPGFICTEDADRVATFRDEHEAALALDIPADFTVGPGPLHAGVRASIRFDDQAQFHPVAYLQSLARGLRERGVRMFEGTPALQVLDESVPVVATRSGSIRARDVIVAANVPVNNRVLLHTKIAAYRSYALGLRVVGPLPSRLVWDDLDPYHYVRSHVLDGRPLLLVGGEDHRTGEAVDTRQRFDALEAWARARFPVESVEYSWSGQIIESVDGLPYIGRNSFSKHVWEATGYGGNGMTFGTLAGMLLHDLIVGKTNPWSELYQATRVTPLASARDYLKENAAFPKHFVLDRLKTSGDVEALPRGSGGVFRVLGRKAAVYKDHAGELHAVDATCPHLGCQVEFNEAETTWDCPCHGSRFDIAGRVLNGPAVEELHAIPVDDGTAATPIPVVGDEPSPA